MDRPYPFRIAVTGFRQADAERLIARRRRAFSGNDVMQVGNWLHLEHPFCHPLRFHENGVIFMPGWRAKRRPRIVSVNIMDPKAAIFIGW